MLGGACAPSVGGGPVAATTALSMDDPNTYKIFAFGYNAIAQRHLNSADIATVAIDGMHGFATIDPGLDVEIAGTEVRLLNHGQLVASYPMPKADDLAGWTHLTVMAALDSRSISDAMGKADAEAVYEAVFDATLSQRDRFSRYASYAEARDKRASRNGFGGIGIRYDVKDDGIAITEVMPDSPAVIAGLQEGDRLTHVDGAAIAGLDRNTLSRLLRGVIGSEVVLTLVSQHGALRDAVVRRGLVVPPTVTMVMADGIAQIKIASFNQSTAKAVEQAVEAALTEAQASQTGSLKGILLDLRGNPGGLLDQAVEMADLFMARGPIVSTRGRHSHANQHYEARPGGLAETIPLAVLVDGRSASAAEIVASALQDSGRAVVVGTNSYGKGTVQTVIRMPNDGEMTLTWSRFHSPSGYALHDLGVLPTICTSLEQNPVAPSQVSLIAEMRDVGRSATISQSLAVWRASDIEQVDLRKGLRATCPSEKHASSEKDGLDRLDTDVAMTVLSDGALYRHALSMSAPVTTAGSPHLGPNRTNQTIAGSGE